MPRLHLDPRYGTYHVIWTEDGTQRQKSLKTREEEKALVRFRNFERDLRAGKVAPISEGVRIRLYAFADEFEQYAASNPDMALQTGRIYGDALAKAKACWGDIPLQHITERHLDRYRTNLANDGLRAPTINKHVRHLKAALRKGFRWYKIRTDIQFPSPLKERLEAHYFTAKQLRTLTGKMSDDPEFGDLCMLSAYTGLRSGELVRLVRDDIDNPKGFLRINALHKNAEEWRIWINRGARAILDRATDRARAEGRRKLFRLNTVSYVSHLFKSYARAAGFGWAHFHHLRHTFGSHLAMSGNGQATIQELMRAKSPATVQVYIHLTPEHLRAASESINYGPIVAAKKGKKES